MCEFGVKCVVEIQQFDVYVEVDVDLFFFLVGDRKLEVGDEGVDVGVSFVE